MLDFAVVLTKGGLVLWQREFVTVRGSPVNALIREVLIEERASSNVFTVDQHALKWQLDNVHGLLFVIGYPKAIPLTYVDPLLASMRKVFVDAAAVPLALVRRPEMDSSGEESWPDFLKLFDVRFDRIRQKAELAAKQVPLSLANAPLAKASSESAIPQAPSKKPSAAANSSSPNNNAKNKTVRKWNDKVSKKDAAALDFSQSQLDLGAQEDAVVPSHLVDSRAMEKLRKGGTAAGAYNVPEMEDDDDDNDDNELATSKEKQGGLFSFLQNLSAQRTIDEAALEPVLKQMKEHLIQKNVAAEIASHLCESVGMSLRGKQLGTFTSLSGEVKKSLELALKRILTPKTSTDILRDISTCQSEGRPYTITFIGVNGVGKSTNLSKTCFWLLQNKLKVLVAACDTFRSGAVEQLRVHVRNLKALDQHAHVELFERGYGKDAGAIAKDAIQYAKTQKFDVVLIDTAGRMQDNEPLMRSLAKLVTINNPDKIIFVGEALVGNEAVDQLTKFNRALQDFSGLQSPRQIDGMILSKFDTIDDKVGAALSMTYTTGKPVLFVGTGQTYTDLKRMNIRQIVNLLVN